MASDAKGDGLEVIELFRERTPRLFLGEVPSRSRVWYANGLDESLDLVDPFEANEDIEFERSMAYLMS